MPPHHYISLTTQGPCTLQRGPSLGPCLSLNCRWGCLVGRYMGTHWWNQIKAKQEEEQARGDQFSSDSVWDLWLKITQDEISIAMIFLLVFSFWVDIIKTWKILKWYKRGPASQDLGRENIASGRFNWRDFNERAVCSSAHKVSGEARIWRIPSQQPKEGSVSVVQSELGRSWFETTVSIARGTIPKKQGAWKKILPFFSLPFFCKTKLLLGLPLAQTKKSTIKVGMADCVSMEDTEVYESRRGGTGVECDPPNSRP